MSHPMIKVEHLSKQYKIGVDRTYKTFQDAITGAVKSPLKLLRRNNNDNSTFWALKDVSFEVEEGEVVGIIGRNGAGKSTLLKILSRITEPTEGRITMHGRVASLLEVGTGFHPELTGRENIYLSGSILGMTKREIDAKFDEIVKFAEIEKFLDTPVKRYSSGMYVRLAFAVAAHLEPEILLVDEVLAVGDAVFQKKCLGKMKDVSSKEGRTVLFVSHNMKVVEALCSKTFLLDQGTIIESGITSDVTKFYSENVGGTRDEKYHVITNKLIWKGILNRNSLDNLEPNDDLFFIIGFESGNEDITKFQIDCAIFNEKDERIIHSKSKFVTEGFNVPKKEKFCISYKIVSPMLAPGRYHMAIFAYSGNDILFWAESINACHIVARSYFGIVDFFDEIKAAIIPKFSFEITKS
jgi:ABC-type polysaccharide/polyol phosphate transport system ATPase subunit